MPLSFDADDTTLAVHLSGRLDGTNAADAEQALLARIQDGPNHVILDMSALEYISSAGLRVVLLAAKHLRKTGGTLSLCGMREHIREVFEVSGFLSLFAVSDDLAAARAAAVGRNAS
jgi:stage II sporulation protein AA (anti-sigma F factor antagonist)